MAVTVRGKSITTAPRGGRVRDLAKQSGGQTRIRRELANQRKAMGEAGRQRAKRGWGIRESKAKGARGGSTFTGRNG